jgi:hypothetical protein
MGGASALFDVAGLGFQLRANEQQAQAQDQQNKQNLQMANDAAGDALRRGQQDESKIRMQGGKLADAQHTAYANSGIDASSGTAADVQAETRATTEFDARTAQNNAAREAWGFKTYGAQYLQKAQLDAQRNSNQQVGTLLTGAAKTTSDVSKAYGNS